VVNKDVHYCAISQLLVVPASKLYLLIIIFAMKMPDLADCQTVHG